MGGISSRASSKCSSPSSSITTNNITIRTFISPLSNKMKEKEIVETLLADPGTPLFIFLQEAVLPRGRLLHSFFPLHPPQHADRPVINNFWPPLVRSNPSWIFVFSLQTPGPASSRQRKYVTSIPAFKCIVRLYFSLSSRREGLTWWFESSNLTKLSAPRPLLPYWMKTVGLAKWKKILHTKYVSEVLRLFCSHVRRTLRAWVLPSIVRLSSKRPINHLRSPFEEAV